MICELEGVNNRDDVEDLVVFSTDNEVMYPSLDTDQVAADLAREFLDCELGWRDYDETELALYLALEMETDVIPGPGTCNKDCNAESHLFLQNRDRICVRAQ